MTSSPALNSGTGRLPFGLRAAVKYLHAVQDHFPAEGQDAVLCWTTAPPLLKARFGGGVRGPRMLATRAAFLSGHDISQSHAARQLNASLLFFFFPI